MEPLRQELALHPGPRAIDGAPTWTVQDPTRNRFFRLDWLTFEVLCHWEQGTASAIAAAVRRATPLDVVEEDVIEVRKFLADNELLAPAPLTGSAALARLSAARRQSWLMQLIHNYLFFRVPLARPDRLLGLLLKPTAWLFSSAFMFATLAAFILGATLVARQWDSFKTSLLDTLTPLGFASYAAALVFAKLLHEFGHGLAARRHGCRVPAMGVAFMVLWPVPYTDVNEAWKLRDRWARLRISVAGVVTEIVLAIWATLAWSLLEDGPLRSAAFLLATTTWISTLLVNLSPFMRFDGYFVLSDLLDMPNLHTRCFALARWKLREWLFALGDDPPEFFPPRRAAALVFFAWFVWIYRLVVFLGIAVLVYAFFIKALGIVLFLIEIAWFIAMPITSEIKVWWARRADIGRSPRSALTLLAVAAAGALLLTPLPWRVQASGLLRPGHEHGVYALDSARMEALHVRDGQRVAQGDTLFTLSSPLLDERRQAARSRVERLSAQADAAAVRSDLRDRLLPLQAELETARASLRGIDSERGKSTPKADVSGVIRLADPDLRAGVWVARNERLAIIVDPARWEVEAYIRETDLGRLQPGAEARFYPQGGLHAPLPMRLAAIERDAAPVLASGVLTKDHGGSVSAREVDGRFVPEQSVYRVRFETLERPPELASQTRRGTVTFVAEEESVAVRALRFAVAVLWREAGW